MSGVTDEWSGSTSHKLNTWKAHIPGPTPDNTGYHPLYNVNQRSHYPEQRSKEYQWTSVSKHVPVPAPIDRPTGKYFNPNQKFTQEKSHYEKRHDLEATKETIKTLDNPRLTKVTYDHHNSTTLKTSGLELLMTRKHRIRNLEQ
jgi:galactose mutarotase-like enzyme